MNFKKITFYNLGFLLFALFPGLSMAQIIPDSTVPAGYSFVWSDEFNQTPGSGVDKRVWNYALGKSPYNEELEIYTDDLENISIQAPAPSPMGGKPYLAITATKNEKGDYLSARINTAGHKT